MYDYMSAMNGYNPNPLGNITFQSPLQPQRVIKVHGMEGARANPLAPNSSMLMLDDTRKIIWCEMTDGAGFVTVAGYPYGDPIYDDKPIQHEQPTPSPASAQEPKKEEVPVYVTTKEFDDLKATVLSMKSSVDAVLKELK